ncbi:MAG: 2-amino-4-hydroxy-6-hydroxymethyldihydropteridine diphosphokinase [Candidatus Zixiibacteriota bacterium]
MIFIGLGSNIGDRKEQLMVAIEKISKICNIIEKSHIYETKPWGKKDQNNFLNMAIAIDANLSPEEALLRFHKIEEEMGRKRIKKWGQRNIDIDIISWNNRIIDKDYLHIPHIHLKERDFFLQPCIDIDSDAIEPKSGMTFAEILSSLPTSEKTIIGVFDG